jgi:hypothetical protein
VSEDPGNQAGSSGEHRPLFIGADINERLWPLDIGIQRALASVNDVEKVEGRLFVRPEDGAVVFRQVS